MVSESAGENSFKIGLLVFEILHNQYFRKPYLLSFLSNCNGVLCSKWQYIPWTRRRKDVSNRTSHSKVMAIFQFICKCYAITCKHVKCMYILSLLYGLSLHNSFSSWPNVFKFSTVVVDKGTSGCRSITSSIYLNWNICVIYYRIKIKFVFEKADYRCILIRKNCFFKSLPVSQTWRH